MSAAYWKYSCETYRISDAKEKELAEQLQQKFSAISDWNHDMIFTEMKILMQEYKVRMPVFYRLLTGSERGLPLPQVIEILGKEKTLSLLENFLK